jgi:TRAP-type C4-dicarboxylate transport system substrate-binding protein
MFILRKVTLAACAAWAGVMMASAVNADVKLDLANEYSATSLVGQADTYFVEAVKKHSNSEIVITPHFGGALGFKSKDHFDAVGDGAVPIAGTYTGVFSGIDPVFALSAMPFQAPSLENAIVMFEVAKPYYEKVFKKHNQKLLYASPYTPTGIWASKAVISAADLKDLKIRTYDAAGLETLKAIGAAPIQLSWADVVPQLSTGGIDAVLTSDESGINGKFWEHLTHFNAVPYSIAINMTHMNLDTYNGLTESQRTALDKAVAETQAENWRRVAARVERNAKILQENKVTVVEAPKELVTKLQSAAQSVLDDWLAKMGEDGKAIMAAYQGRASN